MSPDDVALFAWGAKCALVENHRTRSFKKHLSASCSSLWGLCEWSAGCLNIFLMSSLGETILGGDGIVPPPPGQTLPSLDRFPPFSSDSLALASFLEPLTLRSPFHHWFLPSNLELKVLCSLNTTYNGLLTTLGSESDHVFTLDMLWFIFSSSEWVLRENWCVL